MIDPLRVLYRRGGYRVYREPQMDCEGMTTFVVRDRNCMLVSGVQSDDIQYAFRACVRDARRFYYQDSHAV